MSNINQGGQKIGWKYSTPLQADYLNTFIAGITSPGLVTRPDFEWNGAGEGDASVMIRPFSMFLNPTDKSGNEREQHLVKVTVTQSRTMPVHSDTVAIGFNYSFSDNGNLNPLWYGEFEPLTIETVKNYPGLIIATVISYQRNGAPSFKISSQGADISDCLLLKEGWDPCCWLSLVSPKRMYKENDNSYGTGYFNMLEVRRHNDPYIGYISGHNGFKKLENLRYILPDLQDGDPDVKGLNFPGNYNLFNITSEGFNLCDYGDVLPINHPHGGVFAYVNASDNRQDTDKRAFMNNLEIQPVSKEDVNLWYEISNGKGTLTIK